MREYIHELLRRKDLVLYLVFSGLKAQHKNSFLGYFWWLLDPMLNVLIYYFVVVIVFQRAKGQEYGVYLVIGMMVWRWLASTVNTASKSIVQQAGIISQVNLPKAQFPIGSVITQFINFGFGLIIIAMFLLFFRIVPGPELCWLPFIVCVQLLFMFALALPTAFISVFIRDVETIISHLTRLWFFGSPVIWYADMIPERGRWMLAANPMAHLLDAYRNILLYHSAPDISALFILAAGSFLVIVTAVFLYYRFEHKIIKVL
ncbi:MAG: ABC transporter permease [Desulfosalsimonadaceae bacterium]